MGGWVGGWHVLQGAGLAHPLLAGLAHRHHTRMHLTLGGVAAGGAAVGGKAASEAAVEERVPRLLLEVLPPSAALLLPLSLLLRLLLRRRVGVEEGGGVGPRSLSSLSSLSRAAFKRGRFREEEAMWWCV